MDLSSGQWQRLALGRGMMRDLPLLLVLDEPTASLDALTEAALFERYVHASRSAGRAVGAITLLVSHRFSTVRMADLILVLHGGKIVESGSHEHLVRRAGSTRSSSSFRRARTASATPRRASGRMPPSTPDSAER